MKTMDQNKKMVLMLGSSSSILLITSMIETDSSIASFIKGIVVGLSLVYCCAALWTYGKSKRA